MLSQEELKLRKRIWVELSDFYLDTTLSTEDLKRKAQLFKESGLSFEEIKEINYNEVAPLLINNLNGLGEWAGFPEEGLTTVLEILSRNNSSKRKNFISRILNYIDHKRVDFHTNRYWKVIKKEMSA